MIELDEFSTMFERNPIAQTVIDKDFNFVLTNEPFCKMVGFERDRLMTIKFSDLRTKNMIKYLKDSGESVADAIKLRRVTNGESTFETPSGLHIVIRTNIPLFDEKGGVKYVYITYNEVTKIVQAQEFCELRVVEASESCGVISRNVQTLSDNAHKASEGINQISTAMQDMSAAVQEITASMESVSVISKETNDLSKNGVQLAGMAEKSMGEISASSENVYRIVADVEKQMGEISKIVVLIRDLANQTNLLALNAAIEAARAGDAGRGFAVVATEVKSLAQESRNSAERIEEMIGALKKSTQHASVAMGDAKGTVSQGEKMVTEMLQSFNRIVTAVEKMANSASEVAAATQEQAATTEEITASVHEVANFIDKTADEAEGVLSAVEESTAALHGIANTVKNLKKGDTESAEEFKKAAVA
jgi:PAS domain S-box-containing protein